MLLLAGSVAGRRQAGDGAFQPANLGVEQAHRVVIDDLVRLVLLVQGSHLFIYMATSADKPLPAGLQQAYSLCWRELVNEKDGGLNDARPRFVSLQRFAQQGDEALAPRLSNVVHLAFAQGDILMGQTRTRRLYRLAAHLQKALGHQPIKLVVHGWLFDKRGEGIMMHFDDLANLLPVHGMFRQQSK